MSACNDFDACVGTTTVAPSKATVKQTRAQTRVMPVALWRWAGSGTPVEQVATQPIGAALQLHRWVVQLYFGKSGTSSDKATDSVVAIVVLRMVGAVNQCTIPPP